MLALFDQPGGSASYELLETLCSSRAAAFLKNISAKDQILANASS